MLLFLVLLYMIRTGFTIEKHQKRAKMKKRKQPQAVNLRLGSCAVLRRDDAVGEGAEPGVSLRRFRVVVEQSGANAREVL